MEAPLHGQKGWVTVEGDCATRHSHRRFRARDAPTKERADAAKVAYSATAVRAASRLTLHCPAEYAKSIALWHRIFSR
jgi:hypothetical protein